MNKLKGNLIKQVSITFKHYKAKRSNFTKSVNNHKSIIDILVFIQPPYKATKMLLHQSLFISEIYFYI